MAPRRSSATDLGAALVAALTAQDWGRLGRTLAPEVHLRALIPPGPIDLIGTDPATARFAAWFGSADRLELLRSGSDEVGDRLHVFYRLRVTRPGDEAKVVEQHLMCVVDDGRIAAVDLLCSGFRADVGDVVPHPEVEGSEPVAATSW